MWQLSGPSTFSRVTYLCVCHWLFEQAGRVLVSNARQQSLKLFPRGRPLRLQTTIIPRNNLLHWGRTTQNGAWPFGCSGVQSSAAERGRRPSARLRVQRALGGGLTQAE